MNIFQTILIQVTRVFTSGLEQHIPERSNLASVILLVSSLGVRTGLDIAMTLLPDKFSQKFSELSVLCDSSGQQSNRDGQTVLDYFNLIFFVFSYPLF